MTPQHSLSQRTVPDRTPPRRPEPAAGQPAGTAGRFGQPTPYRMTVGTPRPRAEVAALADQLLAAWLKGEGHDEPPPDTLTLPAERLRLGERILLDRDFGDLPDSSAEAASGAGYFRRRLRTPTPHGTDQLTLTLASATPDGPTEVRLEAEYLAAGSALRAGGRVPVPDLVRALLPLLDATDGPAQIGAAPRLVRPADVEALIDELCDPERRLPVLVASLPPSTAPGAWLAETLLPLTRQLTGLAALHLLDHEALPLFNVALEYHKVYGGAVRTYLPEVDPACRADGARHPVLPRHRIEEDVRRAAALLAREPRRLATDLPLPALLAAVPVYRAPAESRNTGSPPAEHRTDQEVDAAERQARADELQRVRHSLHRSRRRERFLSAANEDRSGLRHPAGLSLPGRLCTVRPCDGSPGSFGELVGRFAEFPLLEFTGDQKEALALDGQYAGTGWARLTWEGLTALQEYASAAVRGEAGGDFKQWCEHTPAGCHRFPPRKAVRGESRTVESHTKWKRERMLPVPECVDSSRRAFMGAHLRIGGGRTAPRLHYLDDCSGSGRIYVGYIGLHLTNTRTN
ncbi:MULTISPECIES: hypothetical protein [unclassified Kitasatospora]|uniref:hypothetical protein n=1 Tax=unclassified Kitasatospora TaxID=2633591 RepID=UPI0012F9A287|nr:MULTISPECIES: hypothetical protein [unclassified Kitasatospora]